MSYQDEQDEQYMELLRSKMFLLDYNVDRGSPEECWNWNKKVAPKGYGTIALGMGPNGKWRSIHAHRLVYLLFVGPIPEGMYCLHTCDNRKCCNPAHLWIGTQSDNMRDMDNKGRGVRNKGLVYSEESRKKISDALKKYWSSL